MERLVSSTPLATAYLAGYADGITLLHLKGRAERLQCIQDRYLGYIELEHPTPEARAYVSGFRDAAADNLPCPPHEIESHVLHRAA